MRILDSIRGVSQPLVFTIGLASLAGCAAVDPDLVDGEHDSFITGGKEDSNGIEDGSPEAQGVLRVANETSLDVLDNSTRQGGVGLDRRAAENIVAYRLGDDGLTGTSDDERFDTIAELDAVPYVGPVVFAKLLAYADANGYTGEEDPPPPPPPTENVFSKTCYQLISNVPVGAPSTIPAWICIEQFDVENHEGANGRLDVRTEGPWETLEGWPSEMRFSLTVSVDSNSEGPWVLSRFEFAHTGSDGCSYSGRVRIIAKVSHHEVYEVQIDGGRMSRRCRRGGSYSTYPLDYIAQSSQ